MPYWPEKGQLGDLDAGVSGKAQRGGAGQRGSEPFWPCMVPGPLKAEPLNLLSPQKDTREVVAIKCVAKKSLNKASVENLLTEIEILKGIRHPHIVQLKDFQVWAWDGLTTRGG